MLVRWRDKILTKVASNIESHYKDGPVEDYDEKEVGFEAGLRTAVSEVCKLMVDPSYFGRSPQPHDPEKCGCGSDAAWCPYNPEATELRKEQ